MSSHKTLSGVIDERWFACSISRLHSFFIVSHSKNPDCPCKLSSPLQICSPLKSRIWMLWMGPKPIALCVWMCVNFLDVSCFDAFHLASSCFHGHRKLLFHSDCCSTTLPDVSFCNESTIKNKINKGDIIIHLLLCLVVQLYTVSVPQS